jgi:hypothetical protein
VRIGGGSCADDGRWRPAMMARVRGTTLTVALVRGWRFDRRQVGGRWQRRNRGKWHLRVGEGAATTTDGGGGEAPAQPWKAAKLGEEARRRALLGEEPGDNGSRGRKHGGGGMWCWEEGAGRSRGKSGAVCSGGVGGGCETAEGGERTKGRRRECVEGDGSEAWGGRLTEGRQTHEE